MLRAEPPHHSQIDDDKRPMLAFQPLTTPSADPSAIVRKPFIALAASLLVIITSAVLFAVFAPEIHETLQGLSARLRSYPVAFAVVATVVVAANLFEAGVHVINATGLWFNRALSLNQALSRRPLVLRLSQHVEHLSHQPRKSEYLFLNALDALAFAAAFAVIGEFNLFWAVVFAPHLATMLLAAWELDLFLKLFLLDVRRFLPGTALATRPRRVFLRGHLFMRGAFVLLDAVARTYLCVRIAFG